MMNPADVAFDELWTEEIIESLKYKSDELGDAAAASVYEFIGKDREKYKAYMIRLASIDYFEKPKPAELTPLIPVKLNNMLKDHVTFGLTDDEKNILNNASLFFEKNGPPILMILACRSLLKQYSSDNTSELLGRTSILVKFPHRRIIETMQFVMDVMEPNWFSTDKSWVNYEWGSPAIHSIQKLRLIHALIRSRVEMGELGEWNEQVYGKPISQEEMMMANFTFSLEIIEGLKNLGLEVSDEERDNFFKAWMIIGRLLGIQYPEGLEPQTYDQAWILQNKLYKTHFKGENEYGHQLASALIKWMDKIIPMTTKPILMETIAKINGPENVRLMEEKLKLDFDGAEGRKEKMGFMGKVIYWTMSKSKSANRSFLQELFNHMINALLGMERGGKQRRFRFVHGFAETWHVNKEEDYKPIGNFRMLVKMLSAIGHTIGHRILNFFGIKRR